MVPSMEIRWQIRPLCVPLGRSGLGVWGLSEDMDKIGDIWWLDVKGSPAFDSPPRLAPWTEIQQ